LSQQFISTHHLPATSSVKTALKALVDKQLVSKTPNGYLVSDRFFAKWLVRGGITL
jgi:chaperone required for assembly of F1-ATPase